MTRASICINLLFFYFLPCYGARIGRFVFKDRELGTSLESRAEALRLATKEENSFLAKLVYENDVLVSTQAPVETSEKIQHILESFPNHNSVLNGSYYLQLTVRLKTEEIVFETSDYFL